MIILLRHCSATGQEAEAPLSPQGLLQAERLVARLSEFGVKSIVSSPYVRAVSTIAPFAASRGLTVHTDERLRERILGTIPSGIDWREALRATFDNQDVKYGAGESTAEATARLAAALAEHRKRQPLPLVIVTHGNALTLLLRTIDPQIGFSFWEKLATPDIIALTSRGDGGFSWQQHSLD